MYRWFEGRTHGERRQHRRTRTSPAMVPMTPLERYNLIYQRVVGKLTLKLELWWGLVFKRLKSRPMTPVRKPLDMYFVQSWIPRERAIDIESPPMAPVAKPLGRCKRGQF